MGWMHDTLKYLSLDPIYRRYHHNLLTFRMMYAHSENFALSLSHDEVAHEGARSTARWPATTAATRQPAPALCAAGGRSLARSCSLWAAS